MIASITKPKSAPTLASTFVLTPEQDTGFKRLEAFLESQERMFLLTGYAGTGKTTILSQVVKSYLAQHEYNRVALCAMSNKATKVISRMAKKIKVRDEQCNALTLCSLLGLRPQINAKTGKQEFRRDPKTPATLDQYDLVVIDECSRLSAEMWEIIQDALLGLGLLSGTQVIFTGDPAQLPPVGEVDSPSFHCIDNKAHLSKVVRYDGAVGQLAERVRITRDWHTTPIVQTAHNAEASKGVWSLDDEAFGLVAEKLFGGDEYAANPDYGRLICYRNRTVDKWNARIHACIYGPNAPRFQPGLTLMANSPVFGPSKDVIIANSEEVRVEGVREGINGGWKVWVLDVKVPNKTLPIVVFVLHESEVERFNGQLKVLSAAKQWHPFWRLKQQFADLKYAYAITAHKAQGSTFRNVFVPLGDLLACRQKTEIDRLIYVAITRASHRVFVTGGAQLPDGLVLPPMFTHTQTIKD
ncbi:MAG: AAA family ATPase [Marinagarivorans sp.]|nr:AAA family ATPase [Marinagarivorans sp.]